MASRSMNAKAPTVIPWSHCEACDDFVCNLHPGEHVHDCPCPAVDQWLEQGLDPYCRMRVAEANAVFMFYGIQGVESLPEKQAH